ncbi:MAG: 1-acyl-sn-glycerol-3-phosphate acyltransferase [Paramuribaculum sp.]|nr:1-acyl-sn-glycerol-3-phosphate acyltransferase [Paramuribaculum sp.]
MIYLYRIYQCVVMLPVLLVATVVTALIAIAGSMLGAGRWCGYWPEVVWARLWCAMAFVRVKVRGKENISPSTSYVFVANHQSAYDIFSVYGYLGHSFRWMMKQELRRIPLVGLACEKSGQIFVDRSSPAAIRHTMERAEKQLSGGMSLVVFPEGARTWDGKMRQFKRGAFLLATEFNLPVVPVTIDGAFDVMPRTARMPRWGTITLTIHKPILPPEGGYDLPRLMEESREKIASVLPE